MIDGDTVEALRDLAKSRPISEGVPGRMEGIYLLASVAADEIASLRAEVSYLNGALSDSERLAMAMTRQVNARVDRENDVLRIERKSILAIIDNTEQYINGKKFPERDGVYGAEDRLNEILLLLRHRLETTPAE